jgi:hypothetical protein
VESAQMSFMLWDEKTEGKREDITIRLWLVHIGE